MKLLTPQEVAEMLQVSPRTLEDWRSNGRGPAYILVEGSVRYETSVIKAYIEQNRVQP